MLDNLKQMKEQGIFKMLPYDIDLDKIVAEATASKDIIPYLDDIKIYVKDIINDLEDNNSITIGTSMSDFYDKFNDELFEIYLAPINAKSKVYTKEVTYGKAGKISIGMRADNIKFTLEERKLMKIINHHYISLKANNDYNDEAFFIPYSQLRLMFSNGINHQIVKEKVVETCHRIMGREIFWDFTATRYAKNKNLKQLGLVSCKGEEIVDISIIYQPRTEQTATIKGIICKVTKFMKLRYALKQISNYFPTRCLQGSYLEFVIADRLLYHIKLQRDKKLNYKIDLSNLAKQIYTYKDGEQSSENFMRVMYHDDHKPTQQLYLLRAISKVAEAYATNRNYFPCEFNLIIDNGICIPLMKDLENARNEEHIFNEIKIAVNGKEKLQPILEELKAFRKELHDTNKIHDQLYHLKRFDEYKVKRYIDLIVSNNTESLYDYVEQCSDDIVNNIKARRMNVYEMIKKERIKLVISSSN